MSPDTIALVEAINGLKQSGSIIKSYLLPFIQTLFATCIGFVIASYTFRKQEAVKADAKKMMDTNKFIIQIDSAFQSLIAFKSKYKDKAEHDPIKRTVIFGVVNMEFAEISGVEELMFLAKGNKSSEGEPYYRSWNNLPRISSMVSNYKYLVKRVESRNELRMRFESSLSYDSEGNKVFNIASLNPEQWKILLELINENEIILNLTDGLILEMHSFLLGITEAIKNSINIKKVLHLVTLVTINTNNEYIIRQLEPISPPDYSKLAELLKITEDEAKYEFSCGYF